MMSAGSGVRVLRGILKELRKISVITSTYRQAPEYQFLLQQYREFGAGASVQGIHNAAHYLCLLQSLRRNKELCYEYKGMGERPVEEMAKMVGFRLPQKYSE